MRSASPDIPSRTQWELDHPAAPGGRHPQMVKIASALTRQGRPPAFIWGTLRSRYGPDISDHEIEGVVRWAARNIANAPGGSFVRHQSTFRTSAPRTVPSGDPAKEITRLLGGFSIGEADLLDQSPVKPSANWREDSLLVMSTLFQPDDRVNIVTRVFLDGEKPRPAGTGRTLFRDQWIEEIRENGVGEKEGGAWIRMNPVSGKGVSDQHVTAFRFALLECDAVPIPLQISLFARLPLPIAAIITSGGRSVHA